MKDMKWFEEMEARIPKNEVRTRFAPSPTGYMPVGTPSTAIYTSSHPLSLHDAVPILLTELPVSSVVVVTVVTLETTLHPNCTLRLP